MKALSGAFLRPWYCFIRIGWGYISPLHGHGFEFADAEVSGSSLIYYSQVQSLHTCSSAKRCGGATRKIRRMSYWQALGAFVMVLALPACADIPSELMHRLEQYPEVVHRFNQYPEVIHIVGQHGGSDVVEPKPLANAPISLP